MRGLISIGIYKRKVASKPLNCGVCKQKILPELEYGVRVSKSGGRFPFHLHCATAMLLEALSYRKQAGTKNKTVKQADKQTLAAEYKRAEEIVNRHLNYYEKTKTWWAFTKVEDELVHKFPDLVTKVLVGRSGGKISE